MAVKLDARSPAPSRSRQAKTPGGKAVVQKVKMTLEDHETVRRRAAAAGVSVPRFMIEAALGDQQPQNNRSGFGAELLELRGELGRVANNLNQLARVANIERRIVGAAQLEDVSGEVRGLIDELRELLGVAR